MKPPRALSEMSAKGGRRLDPVEIEPNYSSIELPGKCVKCLAEDEYGICMRHLLEGAADELLKKDSRSFGHF